MAGMTSSAGTLWGRLVEPHEAVGGQARRQQTRRLAALSLILLVVSMPAVVWGLLHPEVPGAASVPQLPLLAIAYGLSRSRRPEWGSGLLTFGSLLLGFAAVFAFPAFNLASTVVPFLLIPVLLSTLLLPARATLILIALLLGGLGAVALWVPALDALLVTQLVAMALVSVVVGAVAFIRERDARLMETQSQDAERYSRQLTDDVKRIAATAEVGRAITGSRDLDALLKKVVSLIVDLPEAYHAQVFLIDETGRQAVLRESSGEVGQQLLARGHRLAVGSQSVIGQVTARGEPLVVSDTDVDPVHRRNELLPETRSEIALPLRIGGRIIGALDIQSVQPQAFAEVDVSVFQTMADQLAIAIENARLFEQAQRDLADIEILNRQLTGEAWRLYMGGRQSEAPAAYIADDRGVRPAAGVPDDLPEGAVSVPLRVRGETIGAIDLVPRGGDAPPDEDTRAMLEAVAERVAFALDSTRLSEQAQRQVAHEQILSRLSAELQAATDMDVILRVTVREAGQALGVPQGFVVLRTGQAAVERQD